MESLTHKEPLNGTFNISGSFEIYDIFENFKVPNISRDLLKIPETVIPDIFRVPDMSGGSKRSP